MIVVGALAALLFIAAPFVILRLTTSDHHIPDVPAQRSESQADLQTLRIGTAVILVESARTPAAWARGLAHRDTLPSDAGMLFVFPSAERRTFWMKDTRIPLDLIWIRDGRVVGITRDVLPEPGVPDAELQRYPSPEPVDLVLEINRGWAAEYGIRVGDRVAL